MNYLEFAEKLIESTADERHLFLQKYPDLCNVELAKCLQQICYEVWTGEPQKVAAIAETFHELTYFTRDNEIKAYSQWTEAIRKLVGGLLDECIFWLDNAEKSFLAVGKPHSAATTQISKLYALALLGRYDEAVACGLRAREVFLVHHDLHSVGKIEHNIGNLYWRRDLYRESEPYLESANARFTEVNDQRQLAMVENCQAFVKALQNEFYEAEIIYKQALSRAKRNNLTVTEAEIEIGMSNLYLFRGKYDFALKYMESSRRKYDLLEMPHQSAICELEIADIYLELNLLPEAVEFYEKAETKFTECEMQAELGRSFFNHAKALFLLGENDVSGELLNKAEELFEREGNKISVASAKLAKAQLFFRHGNFKEAETYAAKALEKFVSGGNLRYELMARWLLGEICIGQNETEKARKIFTETWRRAMNQSRQIEFLCLVSLGKITGVEELFREAVEIIENTNSMLSGDEFRIAFSADKLLPYNELVKINLAQNNFTEALRWHERSRSRTLLEKINTAPETSLKNAQLTEMREELNWFYSRINRQTASGLEARREVSQLRELATRREKEFAEFSRRSEMSKTSELAETEHFDSAEFRKNLSEATVIEFAVIDGQVLAFVVNRESLEVFPNLVDEKTLNQEIEQFIFQIKTARFQEKLTPENRRIAFERLLRRARNIYDILLRPLEKVCRKKRLTIVPTKFLHYLPFQALHEGEKFLIESKEISYAPSLAVLQSCLKRKAAVPKSVLLVSVTDKITPFVKTEIENLSKLFGHSIQLTDEKATLQNLAENIEGINILHLACHGIFRPDNPNFSALALFEENLTVTDAQTLPLQNKFVTLSACETGLNKIVAGEEVIGLTRGFLAAGASSLLLSLWAVNDESTLDLMENFYRELLLGNNPGRALQIAQIKMLKENSQPYFWSPFNLIGHW